MKKTLLVLLMVFVLVGWRHKHRESWYQEKWCDGETEVRMVDKTRVDCLTDTHAIEWDWAHRKWYEGVGQALHYGNLTGKKPGIALIIEKEERDLIEVEKLMSVIKKYELPIDVWIADEEKITKKNP